MKNGYFYLALIVAFSLGFGIVAPIFQRKEDWTVSPIFARADDTSPLGSGWTIEDNKVFVNDSLVYASAEPHTIASSDDVVFEFKSKVYTGNVDFCWGFNENVFKPKAIWLWQNYTHYYTTTHLQQDWGSVILNNVAGYQSLGIKNYDNYSVDLGNKNNTYLYRVNYSINQSGIYAFTTYSNVGSTYTLSGNYSHLVSEEHSINYFDWNPWNVEYTNIQWNHENMTNWYLTSPQAIVANMTYQCKIRMELQKYGLEKESGKYWFAFKPSTETLSQAVANNHFYCLDPWYNTSWLYSKKIVIDHTKVAANLTNFPVLFVNTSDSFAHAQADGDDFVFVASDNTTKYKHEIENFSSNQLIAWVNITNLSSTVDTVLWLYYGNPTCSSQQNKYSTWNSNYKIVQHLFDRTTSTTGDSTSNKYNGTKKAVNEPVIISGKIDSAQDFDGNNDFISCGDVCNFERTDKFTLSAWVKIADASPAIESSVISKFYAFGGYTFYILSNDLYFFLMDAAGSTRTVTYTTANPLSIDNTWYHVAVTYAGTSLASGVHYYVNGNNVAFTTGTNNLAATIIYNNPLLLGAQGNSGGSRRYYFDGIIDEARVIGVERTSTWILTEYNNQNSTSTFLSVGSENEASVRNWKNNGFWNVSFMNNTKWKNQGFWNVSFRNSSTEAWKEQGFWNVSFRSTLGWEDQGYWNISFRNSSVTLWKEQGYWNVSFRTEKSFIGLGFWNISFSNHLSNKNQGFWNISFMNTSTEKWRNQGFWNISFMNTTLDEWRNQGYWNVSFKNTSTQKWNNIGFWNVSFKNCSYDVVYVDDNAPAGWYNDTHLHTIQQGVNTVNRFGRIFVWAGNYTNHVIINKTVNIIGNGSTSILSLDRRTENGIHINDADNTNITKMVVKIANTSIRVENSHNVTVNYTTLRSNMTSGIYAIGSRYGRYDHNDVTSNYTGIQVTGYSGNTNITNNTLHNTVWSAIYLAGSSGNCSVYWNHINTSQYVTITTYGNRYENNTFRGGAIGLVLMTARFNYVSNNTINITSSMGMYFVTACNNTIRDNDMTGNSTGIWLNAQSENNTLFNNIIIGVIGDVAKDDCKNNTWSIGKTLGTNIIGGPYLGGNYYSDNTNPHVGDGFSSPYTITGTVKDYLPLVYRGWTTTGFFWNVSFGNILILVNQGFWNVSFSSPASNHNLGFWNTSFSSNPNIRNLGFWNISFRNETFLFVTNPYPSNGSTGVALLVTEHVLVNQSRGRKMNITWMWGNDSTCPNFFGVTFNTTNGTKSLLLTSTTINSKMYYWKVLVNDGWGNHVNRTYHFTTTPAGGGGFGIQVIQNYSGLGIVGVIGIFGILALFWNQKRKKRRDED